MSSSLLSHGFGLRGDRLIETRFEFGAMILVMELPPQKRRCCDCGSRNVHSRGTTWRLFRGVPIGTKPVFLELAVLRLYCGLCHAMRQPALGFADPKKRHTRSFARYVLERSQFTTLADVARHLEISWDTVKEIQRQRLVMRYARPKSYNEERPTCAWGIGPRRNSRERAWLQFRPRQSLGLHSSHARSIQRHSHNNGYNQQGEAT